MFETPFSASLHNVFDELEPPLAQTPQFSWWSLTSNKNGPSSRRPASPADTGQHRTLASTYEPKVREANNRVMLENHFLPGDFERKTAAFIDG